MQALTGAGLKVGDGDAADDRAAPAEVGKVLDSDPAGGAQVDKGSAVDLTVGAGAGHRRRAATSSA